MAQEAAVGRVSLKGPEKKNTSCKLMTTEKHDTTNGLSAPPPARIWHHFKLVLAIVQPKTAVHCTFNHQVVTRGGRGPQKRLC